MPASDTQTDAVPAPDDVAQPSPDAEKTASGLQSKVLTKGTGKTHPNPDDQIRVNALGWTKDGRMFVRLLSNEEYPITSLVPGLAEGVRLMFAGEKRRFWIPAALAYGEHPRWYGQPSGDLTFDVELLSFAPASKQPTVPEDVKAPPATAKKTASGLAYRLLSSGKPDAPYPMQYDVVIYHHTSWTTDGRLIASTIPNGKPDSFPIGRNTWFRGPGGMQRGVMKGLEEGVQLMKVGDKMRFWIPADLADAIYSPLAGTQGANAKPLAGDPRGSLVFDVELVDIQRPMDRSEKP